MSPEVPVLVAGALAAAFCVGLAGFGDAMVLAAIWLHVLTPAEAVPLIVALGIVTYSASLRDLRLPLEPARLAPFVVAGVLGVPVGTWLLGLVEPEPFRTGAGAGIAALAALGLLSARLPVPARAGRGADAGVGLTGGVLGGLAGLSGALPTLWCQLRGWPKDTARAVYQPYTLAMHALTLATLLATGAVAAETWPRLAWCLPAAAGGLWLGHRLYRRIDAARFRRLVLAGLVAAGAALLV